MFFLDFKINNNKMLEKIYKINLKAISKEILLHP